MKPWDIVVTRRGAWFMGRRLPCTLGRGGICRAEDKREGDGATPAASLRIAGLLYRADRLPRPALWARAIGPGDLWSDDPADPDYNRPVSAPHRFSHERLRRADPMYDLVLVTDWNWPRAVPGRGSAIFIHLRRRPGAPTAGCIGFARCDLLWIIARLRRETRLIIRR